jgi:hypothetical protein
MEQTLHMSENELPIHKYLDQIVTDAQTAEKYRNANRHSTYFKNFCAFEKGDRVSMLLSGIAVNGIYLEQTQRIEGILVHPEMALIDVKLTDGLEEWEGKTIGLGVRGDMVKKDVIRAFAKLVAGDREVSYYVPEDIVLDSRGKPTIDNDKLHHLALKYTRVAVGGSILVDFT